MESHSFLIKEICRFLDLQSELNNIFIEDMEKMDKEIKKVKKHIDKDMNNLLKKDIKHDKECDKAKDMSKKKK